MKIKDLSLPVPYHETFDVLDSTKLQAFMDCPRGFFFEYILGWRTDEPNIHLVFGSAWHEAMHYLFKEGFKEKQIMQAYDLFLSVYKESFPDEDSWTQQPKSPGTALKGLAAIASVWEKREFEPLYFEVAGSVPVTAEDSMTFKMDLVLRDESGVWCNEYKTTGRNTQAWREKWELLPQIAVYTHALKSMCHAYGIADPSEVQGVRVVGLVTTKDPQVPILPFRISDNIMLAWLWEIRHWIEQLKWNFRQLAEAKESDPVMRAFPRNGYSCSKFGCKYPGMCSMWANPLKKCQSVPPGYKVEHWDPRKQEEEAEKVIHLGHKNAEADK